MFEREQKWSDAAKSVDLLIAILDEIGVTYNPENRHSIANKSEHAEPLYNSEVDCFKARLLKINEELWT